jgi:hypothetical protein
MVVSPKKKACEDGNDVFGSCGISGIKSHDTNGRGRYGSRLMSNSQRKNMAIIPILRIPKIRTFSYSFFNIK